MEQSVTSPVKSRGRTNVCMFPYVQPHLYTDTVRYPSAGEDAARIGGSSHLSQCNHHSSSQIRPQTQTDRECPSLKLYFQETQDCVKLAAKPNHGNQGVPSARSFLPIPGQKCLLLLFLFHL